MPQNSLSSPGGPDAQPRPEHPRQWPPRGELWLLAFILVLIATLGLLRLAVESEREAGLGLIESQAFSKMLAGIQDRPAPLQMQGQNRNTPPSAPDGAGNPNSPT